MAVETKGIETRVAVLEAQYEHLATKADLAALRVDLERLGTRLIVWFIGIWLTSVALLAGLIYFLNNPSP